MTIATSRRTIPAGAAAFAGDARSASLRKQSATKRKPSLLALDRELARANAECRRLDESIWDDSISDSARQKIYNRQIRLVKKVFATPARSLEGLSIKARALLAEHKLEQPDEAPLDFTRLGRLLAEDILKMARRG